MGNVGNARTHITQDRGEEGNWLIPRSPCSSHGTAAEAFACSILLIVFSRNHNWKYIV